LIGPNLLETRRGATDAAETPDIVIHSEAASPAKPRPVFENLELPPLAAPASRRWSMILGGFSASEYD